MTRTRTIMMIIIHSSRRIMGLSPIEGKPLGNFLEMPKMPHQNLLLNLSSSRAYFVSSTSDSSHIIIDDFQKHIWRPSAKEEGQRKL